MMTAPDRSENSLLGLNGVSTRGEKEENVELGAREGNRLVIDGDPAPGDVDSQRAASDLALGDLRQPRPSEQSSYAGLELVIAQRFGKYVVGAFVKSANQNSLVRRRRHGQYGARTLFANGAA